MLYQVHLTILWPSCRVFHDYWSNTDHVILTRPVSQGPPRHLLWVQDKALEGDIGGNNPTLSKTIFSILKVTEGLSNGTEQEYWFFPPESWTNTIIQSHGLIPLYHSVSFYFKELMLIMQIVAVFFMKVLLKIL